MEFPLEGKKKEGGERESECHSFKRAEKKKERRETRDDRNERIAQLLTNLGFGSGGTVGAAWALVTSMQDRCCRSFLEALQP